MLITVTTLAALICAISMFFTMHQINRTRHILESEGFDVFNFAMQTDHTTDSLAYALIEYRDALSSDQTSLPDPALHISRFDVLWSTFNTLKTGWMRKAGTLPKPADAVARGQAYVKRFEPRFTPDHAWTVQELDEVIQATRELSGMINRLGSWHYQQAAITRDHVYSRLDRLTQLFWLFGMTLVIAGSVLFLVLSTSLRRSATLVAESQSARNQLTRSLEELRSGDIERRAQNRFLAAASHDLRQPLHAMGLYLSALRRHVNGDAGLAILDSINRSTEALVQLLNSLLDISKLDAGVVEINKRSFALTELFEQLHQVFAPVAQERGLDLEVHADDLWLHGDRVLIERVLRNLINNALNYTQEGRVTLQAEPEGEMIILSVEDTGPGIPEEEQQAIFNEYYQLHNPERDRTKGLGLGLSIVKRLVRLLDIELRIRSEVGEGTRFEVVVPRGTARLVRAEQHKVPGGNPAQVVAGLTILVVDDELDVREGMQALLQPLQADVLLADDLSSALNQLIESEIVPDLILVDYRLRNELTGDTVVQAVREELNEDVPAIIITGDTSPTRLKNATLSGFLLLHKPVNPDELFCSIHSLLEEPTHEHTTG